MKNQINAFKVTATVKDKNWLTMGAVVAAETMTEAFIKANAIFKISLADYELTAEPVIVYSSEATLSTDNYPYGGLKCAAFFSVEYNGKKGARTVFQTINPKTGRLNNPKYSTYSRVILPMQEADGKHSWCGYFDFNGTSEINKGLYFMSDFYELFTPEQIESIALDLIAMSKINAQAICMYGGSSFEDIKPLITAQVHTLVEIAKTRENKFLDCLFDEKSIDATRPANYNPFVIR
jgi:hypothetical protein